LGEEGCKIEEAPKGKVEAKIEEKNQKT